MIDVKLMPVLILGSLSLLIIVVLSLVIVVNYLFKQLALREIRKYQNIDNPEVAIVLGEDTWRGIFISAYLGIKFLVWCLQIKNKRFRTYLEISKLEFNNLIENDKIKILYLIGHGSKYGFCLNKREDALPYRIYEGNTHKKQEIHLYHCTHSRENPRSIIDYLVIDKNKSRCFIVNKKILLAAYPYELYKLYREAKRNQK